ncbi:restriction endonuclease subunit S [Sphaerospermopsis sp. LEGE 08334]|uniref:restriction endonuclease subunit S n=1 Tax=Sphaerospermopsis sp. LEGE 08334 TaxID=1828651 RepID=UPI00187DFB26|nr:restriction endonuclease subunit S [Sphaerospermopsis sp. LEGE 08334]MBE9055802.1 restriction endonuclease subunit S [Sphaerospermopsis sp. LEGE 08334]
MSVPDGFKVSEVGVIPVDWEAVLLDSVAKRGSGHTPDKKHSEYWNGNIKWISLKDSNRFDQIYIYDTTEKITMAGIANSSAVLHPSESVVLSRDAGVGKSAITKDVMAVSQHFFAWQCGLQLDNHFLYYWFQFKKSEFERIAIGTTIKTIGIPYFQKLKIPLPPLTEQKAIAQSLSDVDNLITAIDKLITKKRNIKQGTIQELLTGKKRLPGFSGEWEVKKLGDIGKFKKGKNLPKKSITQDGQPCVLYGEIYTKYNYYSKVLYSRISYDLAKESIEINTGDILFAGSGETFEEIGKCFAYLGIEKAYAGGDIIILSPNKDDSYFLSYLLNSYQANVQKSNLGQGSSVIHIYTINLKNIEIPIPPLPEQKAIAKILTEMDEEIEALEKKREKYKNIKQGMMQELLTGKTRIIDN